ARPIAHSPTRTSRRCAIASSRRCARRWAVSCVPNVVVAGASGYTGALAAAIVQRHPRFDLAAVTSRSDAGAKLSDLYPYHRVGLTLEELDLDRHGDADAAIVAYPHGAAAPVVAALHERGVRVVDLSADFRLRLVEVYEDWYVPHPHPELIGEAVYGLPELRRAQIEGADIVANPGCYPTATLLALAPLAPRPAPDTPLLASTRT